jgi:hypothetical protein
MEHYSLSYPHVDFAIKNLVILLVGEQALMEPPVYMAMSDIGSLTPKDNYKNQTSMV